MYEKTQEERCLGTVIGLLRTIHRAKTGIFSWSPPPLTGRDGLEPGSKQRYNWLSMGQWFLYFLQSDSL